ncbi:MAG: metallophosphoesterase, partial [Candidatus Heimdallarchaeota archaeon]|nr:metallophosphoesterase [Candidatus Heimdallarchaeota archaeon]
MSKTKRLFISDIHLSSEEIYKNHPDISWFKPDRHKQRLRKFIDNTIIAKKNNVKDVILLGDIFNTWICPASIPPPSYQEIFKANQDILDKFQEIVTNDISLFYTNGNHDFDLMPPEIENRINGIRAIKYYRTGRIHAEHGNRFDIYNKPDFVTDPAYGKPIGYFISRLVATAGGREIGILDLPNFIDDIIEAAVTDQNIFSSIIEGLAERVNMGDEDPILLPNERKITIGKLKERYEKLSDVYNKRELIADLFQRRYLNGPADRLCQKYDFNIVVFGHTHNAMIDKDYFLVEDRIYANTGSWCKDKAYCVEIDKNRRASGQV